MSVAAWWVMIFWLRSAAYLALAVDKKIGKIPGWLNAAKSEAGWLELLVFVLPLGVLRSVACSEAIAISDISP